ncbi:unnamed protein product, partial [Brachionus calyciflorus]
MRNYNIFKNVEIVLFSNTVKFSTSTCPLIFKDVNLNELQFFGFVNVFIYNNQIGFSNVNQSFNSSIKQIFVLSYKTKLGIDFFNKDLFQNTELFRTDGILDKIDPLSVLDLNINNFYLNLLNVDYFIFYNQNLFETLEIYSSKKTINFTLALTHRYTDEQFCIFKNVRSYNRIHFLVIYPMLCSCTYIWIAGDQIGSRLCPKKFSL